MKSAFENIIPCMFNYMTDLNLVQEDTQVTFTVNGTFSLSQITAVQFFFELFLI